MMNQNGPHILDPNAMRIQRQLDAMERTSCVAKCGTTQLVGSVPKTDDGHGLNARVRCPLCLTGYEVTPEGEIVNITQPLMGHFMLDTGVLIALAPPTKRGG